MARCRRTGGREGERARVSVCTNLSRAPQERRADSPECRNVGQESSMAADIMLWELASLPCCACAPACLMCDFTHVNILTIGKCTCIVL